MTPEELKNKMLELYMPDGDPEIIHIIADELLCNALRDLGYDEAIDIFQEMNMWYS